MTNSESIYFLLNIEKSGNAEARFNDFQEMFNPDKKRSTEIHSDPLINKFIHNLFRCVYSEFEKCLNTYSGKGYVVDMKQYKSIDLIIPDNKRVFKIVIESPIPDKLYSVSLYLADPNLKKLSPDYNSRLIEEFDDKTLRVNFEVQLVNKSYFKLNRDLEEVQNSIKILIHKLLNSNAYCSYPIYGTSNWMT